MSTPNPTPAAVRAAMKDHTAFTPCESKAYGLDPRLDSDLLRDHIRSVAAEMRATIPSGDTDLTMSGMLIRDLLNGFANKLEGKA